MFFVEDSDPAAHGGLIQVRASHKGVGEKEFYIHTQTTLVPADMIRKLVVWVPVSLLPCLPEGCDPRVLTFAYDASKKEVRPIMTLLADLCIC